MLYGFFFFRKEGEAVQDKFYVELRLSVLLGNNDFFILPASVGQDIGHDVYARLQCRQADFAFLYLRIRSIYLYTRHAGDI